MSCFINVGPNKENKWKSSSKAYEIVRSGRTIRVKYGAIEVSSSPKHRYRWGKGYPRTWKWTARTETLAKDYKDSIVQGKLEKGYQRIPSGKIYNFRLR